MLMLAGVLTGTIPAAASAATCQSWSGLQPPSPGANGNELSGVAVLSPCNAWTVGSRQLPSPWDGNRFAGTIDEPAILTNVLSAADVLALYNAAQVPPVFTRVLQNPGRVLPGRT